MSNPIPYVTSAVEAINARAEVLAHELADQNEVSEYLRVHETREPEPAREEE